MVCGQPSAGKSIPKCCLLILIIVMQDNKNQKWIYEQKIKNRLCNIQLEEPLTPHHHFHHYYLHKPLSRKHSDYREISDWTNQHDIQEQIPQNKLQHDTQRFTFFANKRYQSSLLSPKNNKTPRLELSPIVVRFNAKVLSQNLQRSKEKFLRKLKEDPYVSHYQSLYLLYQQRSKKQGPKYLQLQLGEMRGSSHEMHPRTQRLSSIFRLMKKQQTLRVKNRKMANPQNLVATQLKF